MTEFLAIQYLLGKLTEERLRAFVPRFLTAAQADAILSKEE